MTTFPLVRDLESVGDLTDAECSRCGGELVLVEPLGIGYGQWWSMECAECRRVTRGRVE